MKREKNLAKQVSIFGPLYYGHSMLPLRQFAVGGLTNYMNMNVIGGLTNYMNINNF